jgi:ribosomal protein L12E/L44/L45/RPP1/RPP2
MAQNTDIFDRLRNSGIRKKTAKQISNAIASGNQKAPKQIQQLVDELQSVVSDIEDRVKGGPAKRKAAAKKAAATRKREARKRSEAAKKAAETRKRKTTA